MAICPRTEVGMKVSLFIIGVQKGGTTALHEYLRSHPDLIMAERKELHFFDDESLDWPSPDYSKLHGAFPAPAERNAIFGESTPIYIYWPNALERLQAYNPDAKLIVLLRHPAYRAYSHWRMETKRKWDNVSFAEAISAKGRLRVEQSENGAHRVYSYVERGFYSLQLERLFRLFPREQVLVLRTDRLWLAPAAALGLVQSFLDVDLRINPERKYIAPIDSRDLGVLPEAEKRYLLTVFHDDIARLKEVAGVDCDDWLNPEYVEPQSTAT